ncbi:MAG TPA: hypothetical protein VN653_03610 [Anaerolineales bacterium]|nr:hypothetical protein [Anaerolineales bacterium]
MNPDKDINEEKLSEQLQRLPKTIEASAGGITRIQYVAHGDTAHR